MNSLPYAKTDSDDTRGVNVPRASRVWTWMPPSPSSLDVVALARGVGRH